MAWKLTADGHYEQVITGNPADDIFTVPPDDDPDPEPTPTADPDVHIPVHIRAVPTTEWEW